MLVDKWPTRALEAPGESAYEADERHSPLRYSPAHAPPDQSSSRQRQFPDRRSRNSVPRPVSSLNASSEMTLVSALRKARHFTKLCARPTSERSGEWVVSCSVAIWHVLRGSLQCSVS